MKITSCRFAGHAIQFFVPGQLKNPLNGSHGHWSARHRSAAIWKERTWAAWVQAETPQVDGPAHFHFTAYTGRRWDEEEGIMAAIKPIRDQAVRCVCGTDDSPAAGHRFTYANTPMPRRSWGVLIQVTPLAQEGAR